MSTPDPEHLRVSIGGLERDLPLVEVAAGVRIAVLNLLGDVELTEAAAEALEAPVRARHPDVLVTAEAKSIPLAHALARRIGIAYVVLRKSYRSYMGDVLSAASHSITTGEPQTLYLGAKDRSLLSGANVVLVDDVVSTGSTLEAMRDLVGRAGATVSGEAAVMTEGDSTRWPDIIALGHLPLLEG